MAITIANGNGRSSREEASIQQSFCLFWDLTMRIVWLTFELGSEARDYQHES